MHGEPIFGESALESSALPYARADAPKGGELRVAVTGSFDSTHPFILTGRPVEGTGLVFESLMARSWDEAFTLYPLLAEAISTPPDRAWVAFRLDARARFADGTPVTAQDVLFSYETLRTDGRANHRSFYAQVTQAEALDDRTVFFRFAPQADGTINRELPLILALMPVLPRADWDNQTFDATTQRALLGSGPYEMATIEPGRQAVYTRRDDYWGQDLFIRRGLNNVDRMVFDYYRDEQAAQEAFKAGAVNFRREPDIMRFLAQRADAGAAQTQFLQLRHQRPEPLLALAFNTRRPLFADKNVRTALLLAFDYESLDRTLTGGRLKRSHSTFPNSELAAPDAPALPATNGSGLSGQRENLRKAMQLLLKAGYSIDHGVLVNAKTRAPFAFEILLAEPAQEKIALSFTRSLERLGIKASVRTADSAQYQKRLSDFDFDMTIGRWVNSLSPGSEQRVYWGSAAADQPGSRNITGLKSAAVDAQIDRLLAARTRTDLVQAAHALDKAILAERVIIPLGYLGYDLIGLWAPLAAPEQSALYGFVLETLWSDDKK